MKKNLLLCITCFIIFTGCTAQQKTNEAESEEPPITKLSTKQNNHKIHAKNVKKQIEKLPEVTTAHVINSDEKLVIAFDVKQRHRFSLKPLREKVQKKVENMYSNIKVTVSTDQKIMSELEKLETKKDTLSTNELKIELERIINMEKDET